MSEPESEPPANPYASSKAPFEAHESAASDTVDKAGLPPLTEDVPFWGFTATQFLGACNDNIFQQLLLLLVVARATAGGETPWYGDGQGVAMFLFALPFVLFSGFAGVLSDRHSKRTVIIGSKIAEIGVMVSGVAAFFLVPYIGIYGGLFVLFLMALQSTFFGPAKYAILPESLRDSDLPKATGVTLMFTFLAIIVGKAAAGVMLEYWPIEAAQAVCVGVAVLGTAASLLIRRVPVANPDLGFHIERDAAVSGDMLQYLRTDHALAWGLAANCMFWFSGVIVNLAVNAFGLKDLSLGFANTSYLAAAIGVGISIGSVVGGNWASGRAGRWLVVGGAWGLIATLLALGLLGGYLDPVPREAAIEQLRTAQEKTSTTEGQQELAQIESTQAFGFWVSLPGLVLLGVATGLFVVPIQVFLQARPPDKLKGQMIAAQTFFNWVAILLAAVFYFAVDFLLAWLELPASAWFLITALTLLPIALFYRLPETADIDLEEAVQAKA